MRARDESQSLYQLLAWLPRLPGTEREAHQLEPMLGVTALLDTQATEDVVRTSHSPWILHIATHGLFLREIDQPMPVALDHGTDLSATLFSERSKNVAAPMAEDLPEATGAMSRSALALAGVFQGQHAQNTARDGLLTAAEARSLDLEATQLVVLSACETGQGGLSVGQGVYGLRRAFLVGWSRNAGDKPVA